MTSKSDVTVFYASDGEAWANYFVGVLTDSKEITHTLVCLNNGDAKRPPSVTSASVQSPALLLLATPELVDCMKNPSDWFPKLLSALPHSPAVVVVTLDDRKHVEDVVRGPFVTSRWTFVDPGRAGHEHRQATADVLNVIEATRLAGKTADVVFELLPEHISEPGTAVAIIFREEVKDDVKVVVGSSGQECPASRLSPSVLTFKAPEMPPGTYDVTILVAGQQSHSRAISYLKADYSSFDSCRFWSQCVGVSDRRSLDCFLSDAMTSCGSQVKDIFHGKKDSCRATRSLFPTSIHFAAANGLGKFCSALMNITGSTKVCNFRNLNDDNAVCLALKNNFIELALGIAKKTDAETSEEPYYETMDAPGSLPPPPFCGKPRVAPFATGDPLSPRGTGREADPKTPPGEDSCRPHLPPRSRSLRMQTAEKITGNQVRRILHCNSMPDVHLVADARPRAATDVQDTTTGAKQTAPPSGRELQKPRLPNRPSELAVGQDRARRPMQKVHSLDSYSAVASTSTDRRGRLASTPESGVSQGAFRDSGVSQLSRDSGVSQLSRDSGVSQGVFRDSGVSQGAFRDSGVSQGAFRDSGVSQGAFRDSVVSQVTGGSIVVTPEMFLDKWPHPALITVQNHQGFRKRQMSIGAKYLLRIQKTIEDRPPQPPPRPSRISRKESTKL